MYDRFSDRNKKVMAYAREEAQRLAHDYIGTEHILLGIVSAESSRAVGALQHLELDPERIRLEVARRIERGQADQKATQLPFTPQARRMLECAVEEAKGMQHEHVGTAHLLLGMLRAEGGIACEVLLGLGLGLDATRSKVAGMGEPEP